MHPFTFPRAFASDSSFHATHSTNGKVTCDRQAAQQYCEARLRRFDSVCHILLSACRLYLTGMRNAIDAHFGRNRTPFGCAVWQPRTPRCHFCRVFNAYFHRISGGECVYACACPTQIDQTQLSGLFCIWYAFGWTVSICRRGVVTEWCVTLVCVCYAMGWHIKLVRQPRDSLNWLYRVNTPSDRLCWVYCWVDVIRSAFKCSAVNIERCECSQYRKYGLIKVYLLYLEIDPMIYWTWDCYSKNIVSIVNFSQLIYSMTHRYTFYLDLRPLHWDAP